MLQSLAAVVMAAQLAAASSPHRVLIVQLVHRCSATSGCLPRRIIAMMTKETERIWSSLDVRITWVDSITAGSAVPAPRLTVMLEEGPYPTSATGTGLVLGALNLPANACVAGLAHVWIRHVEDHAALVRRGGQTFTTLPVALADTFLGRALGRTLAHEIGHYLLGTSQHTVRGLMRAQFTPQDLLEDAARPLYSLDADQRAALMSCRIDQEAEAPPAAGQ